MNPFRRAYYSNNHQLDIGFTTSLAYHNQEFIGLNEMQSDYPPENKRLEAKKSLFGKETSSEPNLHFFFGDPAVNFPGCSFVILTLAISGRRSLPIVLTRLLVACWSWRRAKPPCGVCQKLLQRMGSCG